jgi:hypothetical protein
MGRAIRQVIFAPAAVFDWMCKIVRIRCYLSFPSHMQFADIETAFMDSNQGLLGLSSFVRGLYLAPTKRLLVLAMTSLLLLWFLLCAIALISNLPVLVFCR